MVVFRYLKITSWRFQKKSEKKMNSSQKEYDE